MGFEFRNMRPHQGLSVASDSGFQIITAGNNREFVDIAGKGALKNFQILVQAGTDSHKAWAEIYIDSTVIEPSMQMKAYFERGYSVYSMPVQLTEYGVDAACHQIYMWPSDLTFDKTLKLRVTNWSATDSISVSAAWLYYLT